MILAAVPAAAGFRGRVRVPGSKSHTNRAMLLAALAAGPVRVRGALECDDAESLAACLEAAGRSVERRGPDLWISPGAAPESEAVLDARDSGTACRFLAAFAAATPGLRATLTGSARLRERPVGPLVDALLRLGAEIGYAGRRGYPPLAIRGRRLDGGEASVDASLSSQFASALLLAAPAMRRGLRLRLEGKEASRAYVGTTVEVLREAGVAVRREESGEIAVDPGPVEPRDLTIPADHSSAIALAGAVAIAGGELELEGLEWPSSQADAGALAALRSMGTGVEPTAAGARVSGGARRAFSGDASGFPDAVPVLSAVASGLSVVSVFSGVENLRIKESDRLEAIRGMLAAAGRTARIDSGGLAVGGPHTDPSEPPVFPTRSDHRIVMASALLALGRGGFVENPRAVEKSYPGFFRDLFGCIIE